jgi:hypothetical protein
MPASIPALRRRRSVIGRNIARYSLDAVSLPANGQVHKLSRSCGVRTPFGSTDLVFHLDEAHYEMWAVPLQI